MKPTEFAKHEGGTFSLPPDRDPLDAPGAAKAGSREDFPRPLRPRRFIVPLAVALAGLLLISIADSAYPFITKPLSALPLDKFFAAVTQFATVPTATLICLTLWLLDRKRRKTIIVFLVALSLSSTVNETIKQTTGRARPDFSIKLAPRNDRWIHNYLLRHPDAPIRAEKRDQWMLFKPHRPFFTYGYASFPSGHANMAFTMAAYLSALYPPARLAFFTAAGGCALARVVKRNHWPEDVLVGGAFGWMISQIVFSWRWPIRLGGWLCERRWRRL